MTVDTAILTTRTRDSTKKWNKGSIMHEFISILCVSKVAKNALYI